MPVVPFDTYQPSLLFKHAHFNTIYPAVFRKMNSPFKNRIRLDTLDSDFIDLDLIQNGNKNLVILCHGLEGSSESQYIKSIASLVEKNGSDVIALNFRSCSGENNKLARSYHSGETKDLELVIQHYQEEYDDIALVGYSLGGNVVLKYLGKNSKDVHPKISKAVAVSTPCQLDAASKKIMQAENRIYEKRFLQTLFEKVKAKAKIFPEQFDLRLIQKTKTLWDFDEHFTAKVHGFDSAQDYYHKSSSKQFLAGIRIPVLILSALDDPFLAPACFPFEEANKSKEVFFLPTKYGGHVGFSALLKKYYWSDISILRFLKNELV